MEKPMQSNPIKPLLIALVLIIMYCSVARAASLGTVKGRVSDSEGAAIKGAHVLFHLDSSGRTKVTPTLDVVRETDAMGNFDVQLEPGFYDVCIMAQAFTPECRKILVPKEGNVQHNADLNADPLVIKHLGDTF
jgi:hypothetical protein